MSALTTMVRGQGMGLGIIGLEMNIHLPVGETMELPAESGSC